MTDAQSQKSAEELRNMHASANWVSWWLADCFNRIFDCSIRVYRSFCNLDGNAQQAFGRAWACLAHPWLCHYLHPRFATKFVFYLLDVATKAIGQMLTQINNGSLL